MYMKVGGRLVPDVSLGEGFSSMIAKLLNYDKILVHQSQRKTMDLFCPEASLEPFGARGASRRA